MVYMYLLYRYYGVDRRPVMINLDMYTTHASDTISDLDMYQDAF